MLKILQWQNMSEPCTLADVLITPLLDQRPSSPHDVDAERVGLNAIAASMSEGEEGILQAICELALTRCGAGSSGISVLQEPAEDGFRWDALAGVFAPYLHGRAPRHDSPCGVSIDSGVTQLFAHPERYFAWMRAPGIPIVEGLVVPLFLAGRRPYGSLWVMMHEPGRQFSRADAELMTQLGQHAVTAVQLRQQQAVRAGLGTGPTAANVRAWPRGPIQPPPQKTN